MLASDRNFWGWQNPAGTLPKQPQIATMKEKPSHHPKREIRAQQTHFGRTEERSIKYEYFEDKFWDRIREQLTSSAFYRWYRRHQGTGEISLERSRCQIFRSSIRSLKQLTGRKRFFLAKNKAVDCRDSSDQFRYKWETVYRNKIFQSGNLSFSFTTSLDMKLIWLSKWYPIGVNLVSIDRGHRGLH